MRVCAVILAGGYSSRMNGFKPLMKVAGKSLIAHAVHLFHSKHKHAPKTTLPSIAPVFVVLGHRQAETMPEVKRCGATPIYNQDYSQGMFSSVLTGCRAVASLPDCDGFFILPVDIPLIRPVVVESLVKAFDGQHILHPVRNGVRGHPPLIPSAYIPSILAHDGQGGLKALLDQHPAREISVWDDGPFMDADTSDDFARLVAREKQMRTGSRQEAEALARQYMPEKGIAHGRAVAQVATALASELGKKGFTLDRQQVYNSGLLHDIAKGQVNHEAAGGRLMHRLGLTNLAEPVGGHRDTVLVPARQLGAKELVCLADKLVRGSQQVSIRQRFEEKRELYRDDPAACTAIKARMENALQLQKAIEKRIGKDLEAVLSTSSLSVL